MIFEKRSLNAKNNKISVSFLLMVVLFFFTLCGAEVTQTGGNLPQSENISQLLDDAEAKRLTNPKQFSDNLHSLSETVDVMSNYQWCLFQFLRNYELAYQGDMDGATESLNNLLNKCEDSRASLRINSMLANIYTIKGEFEKAVKKIDAVIEAANRTDDVKSRMIAYSAASIVYDLFEQSDLSQKYSQLLYQTDPNPNSLCKSNYYRLNSQLSSDIQVSEAEVNEVVQNCLAINNQVLAYSLFLRFQQTILLVHKGNPELLRDLNKKLIDMEGKVKQTGYKNLLALFYAIKSQVVFFLNEYVGAETYAQLALRENENSGNSDSYIIALDILEKVAFKQGEFEQSHKYLSEKSMAEKRVFDLNQSKQMAFMTVKHANLAKGLEIEQLNKQKKVLELENKLVAETSRKQQYLVVLVLTGLVLLGFWTLRIKRRHDYFKSVSEVDHLTKVFTRKAFEEQLVRITEVAKENNGQVNLAILDLDYFKDVNDKYGHLVGDWVLRNIITACEDVIDQDTLIARLGGEEFAIVTPGISLQSTLLLLDKMRIAIENLDCGPTGYDFNVTASFGVTNSLVSGFDKPTLLNHADVALFRAKKNGRNQVVVYSE